MKGRILSHDVDQIFAEFQENFATFANSTYDSLDPDQKVSSRIFLGSVIPRCFIKTVFWKILVTGKGFRKTLQKQPLEVFCKKRCS